MSEPRDLRLLLHIRYREGGERYQRVTIKPELFEQLWAKLEASDTVREVRAYEWLQSIHKSFAEDFDVERITAATLKGLGHATSSETPQPLDARTR